MSLSPKMPYPRYVVAHAPKLSEHPEQPPSLQVPLSKRERIILRLLAAGRSTAEMAAELVVSPNAIKAQVSSLYRKLNVHSREEAIASATHLHLL